MKTPNYVNQLKALGCTTLVGVALRHVASGRTFSVRTFDDGHDNAELWDKVPLRLRGSDVELEHGFITNRGEYVTRSAALAIARAAHQAKARRPAHIERTWKGELIAQEIVA